MTTASRQAIRPTAESSQPLLQLMPAPGRIQRCGGRQCQPGTCDHDESRVIQRSIGGANAPARTSHQGDSAIDPVVALVVPTLAGVRGPSGHDFEDVQLHVNKNAHAIWQPQMSLIVGKPGDTFEQEADLVADMMVGAPRGAAESGRAAANPVRVQRTSTLSNDDLHTQPRLGDGGELSGQQQADMTSLRGGGQPLAGSVRSYFEHRFGYDFGAVRVHTSSDAARLASSMDALAFTLGNDVAFGAGRFSPETGPGMRLLAHELTHVVQQGGAAPQSARGAGNGQPYPRSQMSGLIQRAGDPAAIPPGLRCPQDLTPGRPAGTDLLFSVGGSTITAAHTALLTAFRTTWLAGGGSDDIIVHGFASTQGDEGANWTLSCDRAEAVQAELVRLGIPAVRITVVAHGESTDFSPTRDPNQRVVVSTRAAGFLQLPLVGGLLTARDNFAGRSSSRFGVGEVVDLSFFSFPVNAAASFGGLEWHLVAGGGALAAVTNAGTATYTAPAVAGPVQLELRVASGATAGQVISSHAISIVQPNRVSMTAVAGTAPAFVIGGTLPVGTFGAGFQANIFINPNDVSFSGVLFGEGTVPGVVTPAGSFFSGFAGLAHPVGGLSAGGGGNIATGTPLAPAVDRITTGSPAPTGSFFGIPTCGASDFLWAIPWEFSVAGSPRTPFAIANHHATSTFFCNATIEKAGAGPFCRAIDGTTC